MAQVNECRGETIGLEGLRHWGALLDLKITVETALLLLNDRKAY